ncbi:MAG TPA: C69 family dipeptidase [Anaerolineaceae bacterium]|nr:C69 family dipeptidase [Anaerolineaceae bacterium]
MGANEHGVVIGNEALFTREPYQKEPGLIGMDFLRLALERASTARQALDTIVALLEQYGQGGNCGFSHPFFYHNSYLIGDLQEAWVLETVGKQWAAEKVKDIRTISNLITIGRDWDLASEGLVDHAIEKGWCKNRADFDFARCYSDPLTTRFAASKNRQCRTTELLRARRGGLTAELLMQVLRDHGAMGPGWDLGNSLTGTTVCMHAGYGPVRINQTTGSMVSRMTPGTQTHWLTGTAAPCTAVFKPVWLDAGVPATSDGLQERIYKPDTLFWQHEVLHRSVIMDHAHRLPVYAAERDALEKSWLVEEERLRGCGVEERAAFTQRCFATAVEKTAEWTRQAQAVPVQHKPAFHFTTAWKRFDREAHMPPLK